MDSFRSNVTIFCAFSGLHGIHYFLSPRHHIELYFWSAAIATFITFADINCYNSMRTLMLVRRRDRLTNDFIRE